MLTYYLRRLGQAFLTIFTVVTITFALVRLLPGGPMDYLRAQVARSGRSPEEVEAIVEVYTRVNPSDPIYVQYFEYMTSVLTGDLGRSIWYERSVAEILIEALPWTLFVMSFSLLLSFGIGIGIGALMAYREGSSTDTSSTLVSMFWSSVPYYLVAIIMVSILAYQQQLFPTGGMYDPNTEPGVNIPFFTSALYHATLPIASMVITGFGGWALGMRGNAIHVLGSDYLRVARLSGIPERHIVARYVARNAILPMYTSLMIRIGFLFGGAIILENIFRYEGVGYYLFESISARDHPLMMGSFIVITSMVIISIFFADITYSLIDPRIESGGESRETY